MADKSEQTSEPCCCPYCDVEIARAALPCCQACKIEFFYCPKCHEIVPRDERVCPHCGANIEAEATMEDG